MKRLLALVCCVAITPAFAEEAAKDAKAKPAKVVVTAEVCCMHCTFGEGDSCAVVLRLDEKTPLLLEGQAAKDLFKIRLGGKTATVEGTLKLKGKQMVLVGDKSTVLEKKADDKAPAQASAVIEGDAICARCDLAVADECTLTVRNDKNPIILEGKLASDCAEGKGILIVTGRLRLDDKGHLRIDASKVDTKKK